MTAEPQQQAPAEPSSDAVASDPHTSIAAVLEPSTFDTLSAQLIANGGIHAVDLEVNGEGMTPEQFIGSSATRSSCRPRDAWVTSQGADPATFYSWTQANRAREMQSAALMMFHAKDPAAFAPLLADFQRDRRAMRPAPIAPRDAESIKADRELVTIEGLTMERRAARRGELIAE